MLCSSLQSLSLVTLLPRCALISRRVVLQAHRKLLFPVQNCPQVTRRSFIHTGSICRDLSLPVSNVAGLKGHTGHNSATLHSDTHHDDEDLFGSDLSNENSSDPSYDGNGATAEDISFSSSLGESWSADGIGDVDCYMAETTSTPDYGGEWDDSALSNYRRYDIPEDTVATLAAEGLDDSSGLSDGTQSIGLDMLEEFEEILEDDDDEAIYVEEDDETSGAMRRFVDPSVIHRESAATVSSISSDAKSTDVGKVPNTVAEADVDLVEMCAMGSILPSSAKQ
eukprot:Tbor_TRINITY_DN1898_c0_g1::TRINITY_DN1898_c0_g1_i1::g.23085::m.23085